MSLNLTTERVSLRPTADDRRLLHAVAQHLQTVRKVPFASPADTIRAALRIAADSILSGRVIAGDAPPKA
jgi:uncharacterized protein (DUF1778 family)